MKNATHDAFAEARRTRRAGAGTAHRAVPAPAPDTQMARDGRHAVPPVPCHLRQGAAGGTPDGVPPAAPWQSIRGFDAFGVEPPY